MALAQNNTAIGFIGMGVMGTSMAGHIMNKGYPLHVFTRTRSKAEKICGAGAIWEKTIKDIAEKCNVIITMLGYPADVKQVYLEQGGILDNAVPGSTVIDMTTSSPKLAQKIYKEAGARSIRCLDAPVSGGDIGARNAALSIMVGGDKSVFDEMMPIFEIMGKNIQLQGGAGCGQHTKMANQIAIAAGMVAMCESLAYSKKAGLNLENVLKSIGGGAAQSWSLNNLGTRIIEGDFKPGFYVKHFIKDMDIALESAKAMGLDTPGLALAKKLYDKLISMGFGNDGTQALYRLFISDGLG